MAVSALTRAKLWTTAVLAATTIAVGGLTYQLAASNPDDVGESVVVAQPKALAPATTAASQPTASAQPKIVAPPAAATPAAQPRARVAASQEPAQTRTKGS